MNNDRRVCKVFGMCVVRIADYADEHGFLSLHLSIPFEKNDINPLKARAKRRKHICVIREICVSIRKIDNFSQETP